MTKYIVVIEDGDAYVEVEATDVVIGHNGQLLFYDDERESYPNSQYDAPVIAYFPAGSYNFYHVDGVAEVF